MITPTPRFRRGLIEDWNRRIHVYVGLLSLWFLWLFGLSGILLNHPQWLLQEAWRSRHEALSTYTITPVSVEHDLEVARSVMSQLDIAGEIERVTIDPEARRFAFRVARPGVFWDVAVDWRTLTAEVKTIKPGAWMILNTLHTFNGMQRGRGTRDWVLTRLWVLSTDGVCVGLLTLALTGLYLWLRIGRLRWTGMAAVGAGVLSCGFFVFGLG